MSRPGSRIGGQLRRECGGRPCCATDDELPGLEGHAASAEVVSAPAKQGAHGPRISIAGGDWHGHGVG